MFDYDFLSDTFQDPIHKVNTVTEIDFTDFDVVYN